jgi:hypothetical protein
MMMSLKLKGALARNFIAAALVDQYGSLARDKCCGRMLAAVDRELAFRDLASALDSPTVMTLREWRDANPDPVHGCGHMQGRGSA